MPAFSNVYILLKNYFFFFDYMVQRIFFFSMKLFSHLYHIETFRWNRNCLIETEIR